MNKTNTMKTKQIILAVAILLLGVLIGKFMFNDSSQLVSQHKHETKEEHWTCSMHPQIDLPEFGACPICGMDLIPREDGDEELSYNSFKMTKNAIALANIETLVVGGNSKDGIHNTSILKLSGKISANENATAIQAAHFGGRIEKLYFKSNGEYVKKGDLLATIYSPELVTAQNELIEAMDIKDLQPELYKAVRNKLKNWKITETQIQSIERNKKVITNFNMYTNVSGYIDEVLATEGNHVNEGAPMFRVSNLETVWAVFDVYEQDISALKIGQSIRIKLKAYPNKVINTTINFIDPNLDTNTRTISVRATLPNKKNELKPGMFITSDIVLKFDNSTKNFIQIPKTAVLWTGKRSIVYVKSGANTSIFELREVQLGNDLGENYEIISGLVNGEEIVFNGAFTVDAAAQLQGKKSMMSVEEETIKVVELIEVNPEFKEQLNLVFQDYISLKNNLVLTDANKVSASATQALVSLNNVQMKLLKTQEAHKIWMEEKPKIESLLKNIQSEVDVKTQREAFIGLSKSMIQLANNFGVHITIYVQHCPMADGNKGADWLSLDKKISNPYFGDKMLRCGKTIQTIN